jgi:phospholipid/cholesterol/gamma-HCH transport system substrate-binding protein
VIDGIVAGNPMEVFQLVVKMEGKIDAALGSIEAAGNKIGNLTDGLTSVVQDNEGQLKAVLASSNEALRHFNTAMANMNGVLGNEELKGELMQTLAELPTMFRVAHETLADARGALAAFERVSQRAERNLKNLEGLTEPLGEQGEELVTAVQRSLANVELLVTQLVLFGRTLNSQEGSLAKFAHDRELYDRITQAAKNIEEVSRKLRTIMSDARILADKLARDPSQLGLRGALTRQRSGEGTKYPFLGTRPWEKEPDESIRY